jgi:hypothetical protein
MEKVYRVTVKKLVYRVLWSLPRGLKGENPLAAVLPKNQPIGRKIKCSAFKSHNKNLPADHIDGDTSKVSEKGQHLQVWFTVWNVQGLPYKDYRLEDILAENY